MLINKKHKRAFTLVELLIAMCLIGLISVMLIPSVTQNAEKELFATQLKKVQNDVQQGLLLLMSNNAGTLQMLCSGANSSECFIDLLGEQLEAKNAFNESNNQDILFNGASSVKKTNSKDAKKAFCARKPLYLNNNANDLAIHGGANCTGNDVAFDGINLKNGATVAINFDPNCNYITQVASITPPSNSCGYLEIDVNAEKNPNIAGKDIFYFWIIDKDGLLPFGEVDTADCATSNNGLGCAARVLHLNKIDYY